MKFFNNKNGKFKKNIQEEKLNEYTEKELEDALGGVPYEYGKQSVEPILDKYNDELDEDSELLKNAKGGVPYSEEEKYKLK